MKKNLKSIVAMGLTLSLLGANTMTAFAGAWNQGSDGAWTYEIAEGQNAIGWNWIDGMNYYFDESGKMLADTVTPDGHTVDANGAWTVDGVVQLAEVVAAQDAQTEDAVVETTTETVVEETQASGYSQDSQYPLAHLKDMFVVDQFGYLEWAWDFMYLGLEKGIPFENQGIRNYVLDTVVSTKNTTYLYQPEHTSFLALAKLAGVPLTGYESQANDEQVVAVETEMRKFLESFDWQNASDLEKAIQIAKRIRYAEYDKEAELNNFPYGCLVNGKAICSGYTSSAKLLAMIVDLPCLSISIVRANHIYPVFLVDGVWLGFEGTSDTKMFFLADYETDIAVAGDYVDMGFFAEYVTRSGYTMPSYESIYEQFPNVRNYIKYGENMPGIFFD